MSEDKLTEAIRREIQERFRNGAELRGRAMSETSGLRPYLGLIDGLKRQSNKADLSIEGLILRYGVSGREPAARVKLGEPRMCYRNAIMLMAEHESYTYCEGYALLDCGIPVEHAWCLNSRGQIVDPTWEVGFCISRLGLRIRREYILSTVLRSKTPSVLQNRDAMRDIITDETVRKAALMDWPRKGKTHENL